MAYLFLLAALLIMAAPSGPLATEPPSCASGTTGLVACMAGKLCTCQYDPGGAMTGLPAGFRWDCGILRPGCGPAAELPGALDPPVQLYLPEALSIDRSRTTIMNGSGPGPPHGGHPPGRH